MNKHSDKLQYMIILFGLAFKPSNVVIGALLLGGIAHLMIFQNGYWSDILWMSVILNVGVPIAVYKCLKMGKKRKKSIRLSSRDL